jgi:hypothetical protein
VVVLFLPSFWWAKNEQVISVCPERIRRTRRCLVTELVELK